MSFNIGCLCLPPIDDTAYQPPLTSSLPTSFGITIIITFLGQLLVTKITSYLTSTRLSEHHRFLQLPHHIKQQTHTRPAAVLSKLLLTYNAATFLDMYLRTLNWPWKPAPLLEYSLLWGATQDAALNRTAAVLAASYLFELVHHTRVEHHVSALAVLVAALGLRDRNAGALVYLVTALTPLVVPGVVAGEVAGEIAHLIYRLLPCESRWGGVVMRYAASVHAVARCVQWAMVATHLASYWGRMAASFGWTTAAAATALLVWWVELEAGDVVFFWELARKWERLRIKEIARVLRERQAKAWEVVGVAELEATRVRRRRGAIVDRMVERLDGN